MASPAPILVVDDDAVSRHALGLALRSAGIDPSTVVFLGSGADALVWLEANTPRLVLLDLVMPPPDGYEVLRQLRARPEVQHVPVLVLTALDADDEIARAFEAGADEFLRKPFRSVELVARVRGLLSAREHVETIARRERDAQLVLELTQALASSLDIREILQTVVKRLADVTAVDRCSIVLVEGGFDVGYVIASSDTGLSQNIPLDLDKYPEIRTVLESSEPLVMDNPSEHPMFELLPEEAKASRYLSVAILPIAFEGRPQGVLFLRSRARKDLGPRVVSLAMTIANTTAIALRNAHMLKSLLDQTRAMRKARVEAEKRLELAKHYAGFFEHSADGIAVVDLDGVLLFMNPSGRRMSGIGGAPLDDREIADLLHPDDAPVFARVRDSLARGEQPPGVDLRLLRPFGDIAVMSATFSFLREEGAVLFTFRDVTKERAIEDELRKTKGFLESVIQSSADAIISADLRGTILLFNGAAERCYGYAAAEVVGKASVEALYPPGVARQIMRLVRTNAGRLEAYRTQVQAKGGELVPVSLSAAFIHEGGRVVGSVGVFTDLRERLRIENRLVAAQEELKMREKQAIVAELAGAAAHELNQPLTSVMGYAELLKRKLEQGTQTYNAADVIFNEAERMAEIVRKIGKITRYETKTYVGKAKILDLDRASEERAADDEEPSGSQRAS